MTTKKKKAVGSEAMEKAQGTFLGNFVQDRRLQIATQAMNGLLVARSGHAPQQLAEEAFRYADALLSVHEYGPVPVEAKAEAPKAE